MGTENKERRLIYTTLSDYALQKEEIDDYEKRVLDYGFTFGLRYFGSVFSALSLVFFLGVSGCDS